MMLIDPRVRRLDGMEARAGASIPSSPGHPGLHAWTVEQLDKPADAPCLAVFGQQLVSDLRVHTAISVNHRSHTED